MRAISSHNKNQYLNRWLRCLMIIAGLLSADCILAQEFSVFDVDTSEYPIVKAKFYLLDDKNEPDYSLEKSDFAIKENGVSQEIVTVNHPNQEKPAPISVVMAMDISGSMDGKHIGMARTAARTFVNLLPLHESECAITTFDNQSYLGSDFSHDPKLLNAVIKDLKASGGTNYKAAFLDKKTGCLPIVDDGVHRKSILFLTDGTSDLDAEGVIAKAKKSNVEIHCIVINMSAPQSLIDVAEATGGSYYEDVNGKDEIKRLYRKLFLEIQRREPSEVVWKSKARCSSRNEIEIEIPRLKEEAKAGGYWIPRQHQLKLDVNTRSLNFDKVAVGSTVKATVQLQALGGDFTITNIKSTMPGLSWGAVEIPFSIKKGASVPVSFSFTKPEDFSGMGKVFIENDQCASSTIYTKCINKNRITRVPLKVVSPNGGEVLKLAQESKIEWQGVGPDDQVQLQLSTDQGKSWKTLEELALGLRSDWHVKEEASNSCLLRANYGSDVKKPGNPKVERLYKKNEDIYGSFVTISPNNDLVVAASKDGIKLIDLTSGSVISKMEKKRGDIAFSEDGTKLIAFNTRYTNDASALIYDVSTLRQIGETPPLADFCYKVPARDQYLRKSGANAELVDLLTGDVLKTVPVKADHLSSCSENYIAAFYNRPALVIVYSFEDGSEVFRTSPVQESFNRAFVSNDEKHVIVWSWAVDGDPLVITCYDLASGQKKYEFEVTDNSSRELDIGNELLVCSHNGGVAIVEIASGKVIHQFPKQYDAAVLSGDDAFALAISGPDNSFEMVQTGLGGSVKAKGSDVSDGVFAIVDPVLTGSDLNFGTIPVSQSVQKVFKGALSNPTLVDIDIKSIAISGPDKEFFKVVSQSQNLVLNASSKTNLELEFNPTEDRDYVAIVEIRYESKRLLINVKGSGSKPSLGIVSKVIDLGRVKLGTEIDTLLESVFKNVGKSTLSIKGAKLIGPDVDQFKLDKSAPQTLKKKKTYSVAIEFKALRPGKTSTVIELNCKEVKGDKRVTVFAEVVAPRSAVLKVNTLHKRTLSPIRAEVICLDMTEDTVEVEQTSDATYNLHFGRLYEIQAQAESYTSASEIIDLRAKIPEDDINANLYLSPIEVSSGASSVLVRGRCLDKESGAPLEALITFTWMGQLSKTTSLPSDGRFALETGKFQEGTLLAEAPGYLPVTVSINTAGLKDEIVEVTVELTKVVEGETVGLDDVLFAKSKHTLVKSSYAALDMLIKYLEDNPTAKMELSGHTDNQGSAKLNLELSKQRVKTIEDYLIQNGIDPGRVSGTGYGQTRPIASNASEKTRRLNRRVEFVITTD